MEYHGQPIEWATRMLRYELEMACITRPAIEETIACLSGVPAYRIAMIASRLEEARRNWESLLADERERSDQILCVAS